MRVNVDYAWSIGSHSRESIESLVLILHESRGGGVNE